LQSDCGAGAGPDRGQSPHTDQDLGFMRFLTVSVPGDPNRQIMLEKPGPPAMDPATADEVRSLLTEGRTGGHLFFTTSDARRTYEELRAKGVEFTQEPTEQPYGIEVPEQVVEELGGGKRHAVSVSINGYAYRSTVAPMGDVFMQPISAEHRAGAGVAAADVVRVALTLDTEERTLTVPADFQIALAGDAEALHFFDGLSYSRKQRFTLPIEQAKTPETRARRIEKAVVDLRERRV
jgi:hypothetical protein